MLAVLRSLFLRLPPFLCGLSVIACAWLVLFSEGTGLLRLVLIALLTVGLVTCRVVAGDTGGSEESDDDLDRTYSNQSLRLAAAIWCTAVPVTFWLFHTSANAPPVEGWSRYPYLDRRWLIFLFWITVIAVLWLPTVLLWIRKQLESPNLWAAPEPLSEPDDRFRFRRWHGLKVLFALAFATLTFGPPWNVDWSSWPVNPHETLHWGGIQAIDLGQMPYVGPASVNYGPGAQLAMYAYVDWTDQRTIAGMRETFAVALWIAVFLFSAITLLALPPLQAAFALVAVIFVSPVAGWGWTGGGVLQGFYGWANLLRNIATLVLSFGIYSLVRVGEGRKIAWAVALGVGLLWGGFSYYSQENLFGGVLIIGFLLGLAVAGGLIHLRHGIVSGLWMLLGFFAVWIPVVTYYLAAGRWGEVVHHYFLVPSRFMKGYANTPYTGTLDGDALTVAYYATPVLAVLVGASAIFRLRPLRPAFPLSADRFLVVSLALAYLAAYPSGLLRADAPHFQSTTFAVPILMAIGIFGIGRLGAAGLRRRGWPALVALTIVLLTYWPSWQKAPQRLSHLKTGRLASYSLQGKDLPALTDPSETARRYGPILARTPRARPNVEAFTQLKKIVGDDSVLVYVDVPYGKKPSHDYIYEGFVYFLADLKAGPIFMERSDMVASQQDLDDFHAELKAKVDEFDWLVSLAPMVPEVRIFQQGHPCWTEQTVEAEGIVLYVFGRGPESCADSSIDSSDAVSSEPPASSSP